MDENKIRKTSYDPYNKKATFEQGNSKIEITSISETEYQQKMIDFHTNKTASNLSESGYSGREMTKSNDNAEAAVAGYSSMDITKNHELQSKAAGYNPSGITMNNDYAINEKDNNISKKKNDSNTLGNSD